MIGLNDLKSDLAPGSLLLRERQPARRRMDSVKHRICWGYQLSLSQLLHPPVGKRRVRLRSDIYTFLQLLSLTIFAKMPISALFEAVIARLHFMILLTG